MKVFTWTLDTCISSNETVQCSSSSMARRGQLKIVAPGHGVVTARGKKQKERLVHGFLLQSLALLVLTHFFEKSVSMWNTSAKWNPRISVPQAARTATDPHGAGKVRLCFFPALHPCHVSGTQTSLSGLCDLQGTDLLCKQVPKASSLCMGHRD